MSNWEIDLELKAAELNKSLEDIPEQLEGEFNQAIKDTAHGAYSNIISIAQRDLESTRLDYLKGLNFEQLGDNTYLISLEGDWANKLDEGFPSYDMKPILLASHKTVQVGSRSGQPWVQTGKDGTKYAYVPIKRKPFSKAPKANDMAKAIQQIRASNAQGRKQRITSIFRDDKGNPQEGKVARAGNNMSDHRLNNLTKYQRVDVEGKVQSAYINFRTVSEKSSGWIHPGYSGIKAFEQTLDWLDREIDNIMDQFLG